MEIKWKDWIKLDKTILKILVAKSQSLVLVGITSLSSIPTFYVNTIRLFELIHRYTYTCIYIYIYNTCKGVCLLVGKGVCLICRFYLKYAPAFVCTSTHSWTCPSKRVSSAVHGSSQCLYWLYISYQRYYPCRKLKTFTCSHAVEIYLNYVEMLCVPFRRASGKVIPGARGTTPGLVTGFRFQLLSGTTIYCKSSDIIRYCQIWGLSQDCANCGKHQGVWWCMKRQSRL